MVEVDQLRRRTRRAGSCLCGETPPAELAAFGQQENSVHPSDTRSSFPVSRRAECSRQCRAATPTFHPTRRNHHGFDLRTAPTRTQRSGPLLARRRQQRWPVHHLVQSRSAKIVGSAYECRAWTDVDATPRARKSRPDRVKVGAVLHFDRFDSGRECGKATRTLRPAPQLACTRWGTAAG